jgi:non-heme chloroperoxidase
MPSLADMLRVPDGASAVVERPDGTRLWTVRAGSGPPVVLAHGIGITFAEWSLVMPALVERGHQVIAYDHRGHGRSTVGTDGYTAQALFADLAAVVAHFDLHDAVLAGHSMGTAAVLGALAGTDLPTRTRTAVLVSTTVGRLFDGASWPARMQAPLVRSGLLQRLVRIPRLGRSFIAPSAGPGAPVEAIEAMRLAFADWPPRSARFLDVLGELNLVPSVPSITTPLHLLLGDRDIAMPRERHSDLVVEHAQDADLTLLPGIGHLVNWEAPDAIVDAITRA